MLWNYKVQLWLLFYGTNVLFLSHISLIWHSNAFIFTLLSLLALAVGRHWGYRSLLHVMQYQRFFFFFLNSVKFSTVHGCLSLVHITSATHRTCLNDRASLIQRGLGLVKVSSACSVRRQSQFVTLNESKSLGLQQFRSKWWMMWEGARCCDCVFLLSGPSESVDLGLVPITHPH